MQQSENDLARRPENLDSGALQKRILSITGTMPQDNLPSPAEYALLEQVRALKSWVQDLLLAQPAISASAVAVSFLVVFLVAGAPLINNNAEKSRIVEEKMQSPAEPATVAAMSSSPSRIEVALPMDELVWQELLLMEDEISFANL